MVVVIGSLVLPASASARSPGPAAPGSRIARVSFEAPAPTLRGDAGAAALQRVRIGAGFGLTAAGALPVLIGALLADATSDLQTGAPLLASGLALELTGSALLLPWTPAAGSPGTYRPGRPSVVRVTVGYRQGGVRVGVAGRF